MNLSAQILSPALGFDLPTTVRSYDMGGGEQDLSPSPPLVGKGPLICVPGRRTVPWRAVAVGFCLLQGVPRRFLPPSWLFIAGAFGTMMCCVTVMNLAGEACLAWFVCSHSVRGLCKGRETQL